MTRPDTLYRTADVFHVELNSHERQDVLNLEDLDAEVRNEIDDLDGYIAVLSRDEVIHLAGCLARSGKSFRLSLDVAALL